MGFNKRYFNIDNVERYAKTNTYKSFKEYLLKPDGCIFSDVESLSIWNTFVESSEEKRQHIYQKLKARKNGS